MLMHVHILGDLAKVQALVAPLMPISSAMASHQEAGDSNQSRSTPLDLPSSISESLTSMVSDLTSNPTNLHAYSPASDPAELTGSSSYLLSLPTTTTITTTIDALPATSMTTAANELVHQPNYNGLELHDT